MMQTIDLDTDSSQPVNPNKSNGLKNRKENKTDDASLEQELREAAEKFGQEKGAYTIAPSALINEVFLRLVHSRRLKFSDRNRFFSVAAKTMRNILVSRCQALSATPPPEWSSHLSTGDLGLSDKDAGCVTLACLEDALLDLSDVDANQCRIVEMRFFAGLEIENIAQVLNQPADEVEKEWRRALDWLNKNFKGKPRATGGLSTDSGPVHKRTCYHRL